MLPLSRGVSMATCCDAAITASRACACRDWAAAAGPPGTAGAPAGVPGVAGLSGRSAARLDLHLFLLLLLEHRVVALLLHLRIADEVLPSDHDNERQHDGEDGVLVFKHSALSGGSSGGLTFGRATGVRGSFRVPRRANGRAGEPASCKGSRLISPVPSRPVTIPARASIRASAASRSRIMSANGAASAARRPTST